MTISNVFSVTTRFKKLLFLVIVLTFAVQPINATAADTTQNIQNLLQDTLEALWTGQDFSPDLEKQQKTLNTLLSTTALKRAELDRMLEETFLALADRHKTSRYIVKTMPDRVNTLFSPHINWNAFKKAMWQALTSGAEKDAPISIKVATLAPPGTPWLNVPETVTIPEIEKLSGGKFLIQIYGSGVMGEDTDVLKKMDTGQLNGCGCTALGVLAACPEASVLLLPGLFQNYEEVDYISEKFRKRLDKAFEDRGYILAALIDTGFFHLFLKNYVTGLADIKRQKVQNWFGSLENIFYEELGIDTIPVGSPDTLSSLSSGLFNTTLSPAAWMLGMQAYQYVNFYFSTPLFYSPAAVIINADLRKRIQKQMGVSDTFAHNFQEILVSEFNSLEPEWKRQIRTYEEKSLKAFETKCNIQALTFSSEDMALIEKAGQAVQQKLGDKVFPADLANDMKKAVESYRVNR